MGETGLAVSQGEVGRGLRWSPQLEAESELTGKEMGRTEETVTTRRKCA